MLQIVEALIWLVMAIVTMKQTTCSVALIGEIAATLVLVTLNVLIVNVSLEILGETKVIY